MVSEPEITRNHFGASFEVDAKFMFCMFSIFSNARALDSQKLYFTTVIGHLQKTCTGRRSIFGKLFPSFSGHISSMKRPISCNASGSAYKRLTSFRRCQFENTRVLAQKMQIIYCWQQCDYMQLLYLAELVQTEVELVFLFEHGPPKSIQGTYEYLALALFGVHQIDACV